MNLVLNGPNVAPYEAGKDLNVLIACENAALVGQTYSVLELLEENLAKDGRVLYSWWNFEVLDSTSLRELAATDAATADIILFGIRASQALPTPVADWVQRWLNLRHHRPGAVVVAVKRSLQHPAVAPGNIVQLKQAAAEGQMDFFATQAKERKRGSGTQVGMARGLAKLVGPPGNFLWRTKSCATWIAGRRTGRAGQTGPTVQMSPDKRAEP